MSDYLSSLGFIGGGQMAEALIKGLLAADLIKAEQIQVVEPNPDRQAYLQQTYQVGCATDIAAFCQACQTVVVAVKPQLAQQVLAAYSPYIGGDHLIISIMAGIPLAQLAGLFAENVRLVRVMPNTPALVLAGATAFCTNNLVTDQDRTLANIIFAAIGTCQEVTESLIDAVTGLSGSGPGYVFTFIEALIDGGVLAGLPRPVAEQLALQTVYGSAKLALESGEPAAVLKGKVTSPGGTTIAGIHALEEKAFRGIVMEAVKAATIRSKELGA